ncbi:hypothetical protein [Curtobacterium sp. VKM Ac-1376]|nr:hypothetical protein [Curtobacterium sp. VKM Ac-1376]
MTTAASGYREVLVEPLLALPDAVGWAWAKGGDWRRRCPTELTVIDA